MIKTFSVALPSVKSFNLEEYKPGYKGLLIALDKDQDPVGYIQTIGVDYVFYRNNDGESSNDLFESITDVIKHYPEIEFLELIQFV